MHGRHLQPMIEPVTHYLSLVTVKASHALDTYNHNHEEYPIERPSLHSMQNYQHPGTRIYHTQQHEYHVA